MRSGRGGQGTVDGDASASPRSGPTPLRAELVPGADARLFRHELTPTWLGTAALLAGVRAPDLSQRFRVSWLGCGASFTPAVTAAIHPSAEVVAWDPDPARLAGLRRLRDDTQLSNLTVHEEPEPPANIGRHASDIVVLDGLLDSVDDHRRQQLVQTTAGLLRPGGLIAVTYRTVVGWGEIAPVVRILRHFALRSSRDPVESVADATMLLELLTERGSRYIHERPAVKAWLHDLLQQSPAEIVDQYVNRELRPVSHAQVAESLSEIGAAFVGSARPDPDPTVEGPQKGGSRKAGSKAATSRKLAKQIRDADSPVLAETLADLAERRADRIDLFSLGPIPEPARTRTAAIKRLQLTAFESHGEQHPVEQVTIPGGAKVATALRTGSVSVAELWPKDTPRQREGHLRRALRAGIVHPVAEEPPTVESIEASARLTAVLAGTQVPIPHRCVVAPPIASAVPLSSVTDAEPDRLQHLGVDQP